MYLIHHIFLPPKLPHEDDFDAKYEAIMLETTIDGLSKFKANLMYDQTGTIDSVIAMVNNLKTMHDSFGPGAAVSEEKLGKALREISARNCQAFLTRLFQKKKLVFDKYLTSPWRVAGGIPNRVYRRRCRWCFGLLSLLSSPPRLRDDVPGIPVSQKLENLHRLVG